MMLSWLKMVCGITTITTSLYLLLYLTITQPSCRSSPGPGERTLNNFKEIPVNDEAQIVTTPVSSQISVTRNLSVLVRPEIRTVLVEPRPDHCQENPAITLLIAVFSAPGNSAARSIVR